MLVCARKKIGLLARPLRRSSYHGMRTPPAGSCKCQAKNDGGDNVAAGFHPFIVLNQFQGLETESGECSETAAKPGYQE